MGCTHSSYSSHHSPDSLSILEWIWAPLGSDDHRGMTGCFGQDSPEEEPMEYIWIYRIFIIAIGSWLWRPRSPTICHLQRAEQKVSGVIHSESEGLRTRHTDGQGQEQRDTSSSKKQVYPSFVFLFYSSPKQLGWYPTCFVEWFSPPSPFFFLTQLTGSNVNLIQKQPSEIYNISPFWASLGLRQQRVCLQCRRLGFDPWVKKIPWRRESQPTPVFLPEEFHGQRSLAGCSPWGHKELDTSEWLTFTIHMNIA